MPFSNDEGEPMHIKHRTKNSAGNGVVGSLDASSAIGSGPQVVEYIRELTTELAGMARSANCGSLACLLAIASLQAKNLTRTRGSELR